MTISAPNPFEYSEADTCREFITSAIQAAGWGDNAVNLSTKAVH
jgi:hypothetical protein